MRRAAAKARDPGELYLLIAEEIEIVSNRPGWNKPLIAINADDLFQFRPHFGWRGAIERDKALAVSHA